MVVEHLRRSFPFWPPRLATLPEPPLLTAGGLLGAMALAFLTVGGRHERYLLALPLAAGLVLWALVSPRYALLGLAAWLPLLGLTRRLFSGVATYSALDPLLLVAPVTLGMLSYAALRRGALRKRTPLASAVLVLGVVTVLGSLNPAQGSLVTGLSGLLFVLVPQLTFWVGRSLTDGVLRRALRATAVLAVVSAVYGLWQLFHGFPSWDAQWIEKSGYQALHVGQTIRPFGTSSAASEFAFLLALGIILWVVGSRPLRLRAWLAASAVLVTVLVLESVRTALVQLVLALAVAVAARRGMRPATAVALAGVLLFATPMVVDALSPSKQSSTATGQLVQHQVAGLSQPFNSSDSTLSTHLTMVTEGLRAPLHHPLGLGTGVITIAGAKFGGAQVNTESDISNAAVALGAPGLLAYLAVVLRGFAAAFRLSRRGNPLAPVALGLLVVTALQWLNGGNYGVAWLPWLLLGWVDGQSGPSKGGFGATRLATYGRSHGPG